MIDVLFYEAFQEEEAAIRKLLPNDIKVQFTSHTIQEHSDNKPPAELISIRTQSHIPRNWAKDVKGVLTRSQGYDHLVVFKREVKPDILCGYLGSYCSRAVAEQAVMTMIVLMRKLKKQIESFATFSRDGLTGLECRGRNVFVVGVGHIGRELVDMVQGLRMNVKGFDVEHNVKDLSYVSLSEGLKWADIVFCALNLTKKTQGHLNYSVFKKAKPGVIFINIARGEISPIEDLARLLDEKILGGLGLDVYPEEANLAVNYRCGKQNNIKDEQIIQQLSKNEKVLFTPHNAFNTQQALNQKATLSVNSVIHFLKKGTFPLPIPPT